jgi:dipeptidase D
MTDAAPTSSATVPSPLARAVADRAVAVHFDAVVDTLADLVAFRTVVEKGVPNTRNPEFLRLKGYLGDAAGRLGLDFEDHGAALVLGLGRSPDRLGLLTHADVRPADAAAWKTDPFSLDRDSEPGRLLGRGVEDDKGPVAAALYGLKALRDEGLPGRRRVELIVSLHEESDWTPFREFLAGWTPPPLNIALDALYPVVTGEFGAGAVRVTVRGDAQVVSPLTPRLVSFTGGGYLSQVPGRAEAVVAGADGPLAAALKRDAAEAEAGWFEIDRDGGAIRILSHGVAAHSSAPWTGRNAITQLAALLGRHPWPRTGAGSMVRFVNDLVGAGHHAERFGDLAYAHDVMGRLTLTLATLTAADGGGLVAALNLRRPAGRSGPAVEKTIGVALDAWRRQTGLSLDWTADIGDPYYVESAPHVPVLLDVFRHYTGRPAPGPISVGGGTQARLLPNGVNFGPAMPDEPYTGHSDHEFMTVDRLRLNLRMYTAALVELAG